MFNVGTGVAHSVQDIVELLRRILGRPITVRAGSGADSHERSDDAPRQHRSIRRATEWGPRFSLEDTLTDMVAAYGLQKQPHSAF